MGQTLLVLRLILLFGALTEVAPYNDEKVKHETSEVKAELKLIPESVQINILIRWLATARVKLEEKDLEIGKIRNGKYDLQLKLDKIAVPLVFRNYVNKIEDRFPELEATVPQNVMKQQILHMGILQRKYNWLALMKEDKYSEDVYIKSVKSRVKQEFFCRENIDAKAKYESFLDVFCEAIAASTDYVNKIVVRRDFGIHSQKHLIDLFDEAYNKYVAVFYDAVVGFGR